MCIAMGPSRQSSPKRVRECGQIISPEKNKAPPMLKMSQQIMTICKGIYCICVSVCIYVDVYVYVCIHTHECHPLYDMTWQILVSIRSTLVWFRSTGTTRVGTRDDCGTLDWPPLGITGSFCKMEVSTVEEPCLCVCWQRTVSWVPKDLRVIGSITTAGLMAFLYLGPRKST